MISNVVLAIAGFLVATCVRLEASPVEQGSELHPISVRQTSPMNCTADSNCSPSNITGYPVPNGVKCINNACVCSGSCFSLSTVASRCTYSTCGWYNPNTTVCTAFAPKSQLTAFLLSFFVMPTGAANFYIGQNGLGGAQLALFLLTIIISYVSCCIKICTKRGSNEGGAGLFVCLSCCTGLLTLLISLVTLAWWIADLVIFARNQRTMGNGCPLTSDL
eukprot:Em0003g735a